MSQEKLGEAIGLTFQQVQKYERGANRVGASRLFDISRVLDVPIAYFFDEMSGDVQEQSPGLLYARDEDPAPYDADSDPMSKKETLELVRAYYAIPDHQTRRRLFDLARSLAGAFDSSEHDPE